MDFISDKTNVEALRCIKLLEPVSKELCLNIKSLKTVKLFLKNLSNS